MTRDILFSVFGRDTLALTRNRTFQNIFAPSNLGQQIGSEPDAEPQSETETKNDKQYQNIFAPTNLGQQVESSSDSD